MLLFVLILALIALISYIAYRKWKRKLERPRVGTILVVLGSGGHTMEMFKLLNGIKDKFPRRVYVLADDHSEQKALEFEKKAGSTKPIIKRVTRSRKVGQSYFTSIFTTIISAVEVIPKIFTVKPDLLLINGPGTCIPICFLTKFLTLISYWFSKIIYVESVCRVHSLSLSGVIIHKLNLADGFFVQWPELAEKYERVRYIGRLV